MILQCIRMPNIVTVVMDYGMLIRSYRTIIVLVVSRKGIRVQRRNSVATNNVISTLSSRRMNFFATVSIIDLIVEHSFLCLSYIQTAIL